MSAAQRFHTPASVPELPLDHSPRIRRARRPRCSLPVLRKWNQFHTSHKSIPCVPGRLEEIRDTIHKIQTVPEGDNML